MTKRGVLPPMRPLKATVDVSDLPAQAADTLPHGSATVSKAKTKIEILPGGKKRGAA